MVQTNESAEPAQKRVAISYSWTTPAHKEWVLDLATRLVGDGIDVVLDVWEFKYGDDTIRYMERFVNDETISRVLLVCDRVYAEKANDRAGGVGIETQIISPQVYEAAGDNRFIPVVVEVDPDGKAFLPTYMRGKWYVNLSSNERFEEEYESLVRSIYEVPLYKKPELGERPSYLDGDDNDQPVTVYRARTAIDAIKNDKRTMPGQVGDYLEALKDFLSDGPLSPLPHHMQPEDMVDLVVGKAQELSPYKTEFLTVMTDISRYWTGPRPDVLDSLHLFFTDLVVYMRRLEATRQEYDLGRFIVYELFISCIAIFLKRSRLEEAAYLLEQEYLNPSLRDLQSSDYLGISNFNAFSPYLRSFDASRNVYSPYSQDRVWRFLEDKSRADERFLSVDDLVDTDVTLYARGLSTAEPRLRWSLRAVSFRYGIAAPRIFQRAAARSYFERYKRVINTSSAQDFRDMVSDLAGRGLSDDTGPRSVALHETLFNLQELGTR